MTAQELKNSILQMAVQGKLVPQDPNDEPASVLLERIRAEKEKLIKEGKIKREKNPSVIFRGADNTPYEKVGDAEPVSIADEVPFEIPETWEWVRLGEISTYSQVKKKVNVRDAAPDIWSLDLEDIEKGGKLLTKVKVADRKAIGDKTVFYQGDILYSKLRPYLCKILIADEDGICTPEIVPFKVYGNIVSEYIVAYLQSPYVDSMINAVTYGVKMPRVGAETMLSLFVPVPPLSEQLRIIEKLNQVLPVVEKYGSIETTCTKLNQEFPTLLRKSILQLAVQGKLVPQDPTDEPASVLLERIRAEKERLIAEGKIKRDKHESVIYRRDNSHYELRDGVERCIDEEIPFEVPEAWNWVRLGEIVTNIDTGKSIKCNEAIPLANQPGIVKVSAVTWGVFDEDESKTCTSDNDWHQEYQIHPDDFLISRANTVKLIAACVIVEGISKKLMLSDKILRLSFPYCIQKRYMLYAMRSNVARSQIEIKATGTSDSMKNISQTDLKSILIPMPPLAEQRRICDAIKQVLPSMYLLNNC